MSWAVVKIVEDLCQGHFIKLQQMLIEAKLDLLSSNAEVGKVPKNTTKHMALVFTQIHYSSLCVTIVVMMIMTIIIIIIIIGCR